MYNVSKGQNYFHVCFVLQMKAFIHFEHIFLNLIGTGVFFNYVSSICFCVSGRFSSVWAVKSLTMFDVRIYWFRLWVTCRKQSSGGKLIEWLTDLFFQCEFIHWTEQQVDGILVCELIADRAYSFQVQHLEGKLSWRNYNTEVDVA